LVKDSSITSFLASFSDAEPSASAAPTAHVIQGTFGVIQGTFGVIQRTFGVIQEHSA
jgi:hypothetical protein